MVHDSKQKNTVSLNQQGMTQDCLRADYAMMSLNHSLSIMQNLSSPSNFTATALCLEFVLLSIYSVGWFLTGCFLLILVPNIARSL